MDFFINPIYPDITRLTYGDITIEVPLSFAELMIGWNKWDEGYSIEEAFSDLTSDDRLFLELGMMPREFDELFYDTPEEEDSLRDPEGY